MDPIRYSYHGITFNKQDITDFGRQQDHLTKTAIAVGKQKHRNVSTTWPGVADEILSREIRKDHLKNKRQQNVLDKLSRIDLKVDIPVKESKSIKVARVRQIKSATNRSTDCTIDPERFYERQEHNASSRPSVKYLLWKAKYYEHFLYVYNLVRDCKTRVEKLLTENDLANPMPKDVIVKIGIVGDYTEDDVKHISKRPGKCKLSEKQPIWEAQPLVCFDNESSSKSKLKKNALLQERACHKIFITSNTLCDKTDEDEDVDDNSIISVGQDKDQIEEIITSCLEEPLDKILQKWSEDLERACSLEDASDIIAEIGAIRKKLVFTNGKDTGLPNTDTGRIVPGNVKDYLLRRSDVNSFGIWGKSVFKVFVKKTTNVKELKDELLMLNKSFFKKYHLEIEVKIWTEMQNLQQGDCIQSNSKAMGTLGGFVKKTNNDKTIYALTCNHLFPRENEGAYTKDLEEIGTCVFTTREKGCDFAVIEIKDCYLKSCDMAFRRDDKQKVNANVYSNRLNEDIVHKIGATTDVTKGRIVSPEFYLDNRENIFLVKGTAGKFSDQGDSGSLVFCRPNRIQQTYVDVVGMVYASDLTLRDDDDKDDAEDETEMKSKTKVSEGSWEEGTQNIEIYNRNKTSSSECDNPDKDNSTACSIYQDTKNISFCCRIHTTLDLFKENQGGNFELKFKDDVTLSESDDSNEESN